MFGNHNSTIRDILEASKCLSHEQLNELIEEHRQTDKSLSEIVVDAGLLERHELLKAIAEHLHYEFLPLPPTSIEKEVLQALPADLARFYGVVPLRCKPKTIDLLTEDPFNSQIVDDLSFSLNKPVNIVVCDPAYVSHLIAISYGQGNTSFDEILAEMDSDSMSSFDQALGDNDLTTMAITMGNEPPIIRFVNRVLTQAIQDKASDIHFEPFKDQFRIRYRIDGALYEMAPPPRNLALPVIARIKVLSDLNIAERRLPQDGRIKRVIAGRPVDLRVSTLPTQDGESVVLRVLDKSIVNLNLDALNIPADTLQNIRKITQRPNGIFIVTGPTGSGKTTTLYSALSEVNQPEIKILTAEDPIEYEIEGLIQVPINPQVGFTFAKALRAFLRQDPDKILVGEIRDLETARVAVQASLTGHLVLSTLHTNDAPGAVTRLIDMGLEPYLMAASLEAVLGQRLVRRICQSCRTPYEPSKELIRQLEIDPSEITGQKFYYGSGCSACNHTGYLGRMGLFEMLLLNDRLRELITEKAPTLTIKQKAIEQGMRTLRQDGIRAIFDGATTPEEVLRYT